MRDAAVTKGRDAAVTDDYDADTAKVRGGLRGEDVQRLVEGVVGARFTAANKVDVLRNGIEIFPAMLAAVREAQESIDFVTFVYWTGQIAREFAAALAERARAGVKVRVLLDAVGAAPMRRELIHELEDAGVDLQWFRKPVQWRFWRADHRTHRKILVCDHRVAFTGGVGIAEEWEGDADGPDSWRDTHFRVTGPAVDGLRAAFIADWKETGRPVLELAETLPPVEAIGDAPVAVVEDSARIGAGPSAVLLETLFARARKRIRIATPYFNPDDTIQQLLIGAARRGVPTEVIVPGPHIDKRVSAIAARERYRPMLRAGVDVYKYQPTMYHVKAVLVDDTAAFVGSVNINRRSLYKDEEVGMVVLDPGVVSTLNDHFDQDLERSERVHETRATLRGLAERAAELALRPLRPEM